MFQCTYFVLIGILEVFWVLKGGEIWEEVAEQNACLIRLQGEDGSQLFTQVAGKPASCASSSSWI